HHAASAISDSLRSRIIGGTIRTAWQRPPGTEQISRNEIAAYSLEITGDYPARVRKFLNRRGPS
ncbi:MAG TPA: hypothetical protein VGZ25_06720, partial [Gemmataceae bacterium]|nr:hypothetical protein [Gemmataceae bacterium]